MTTWKPRAEALADTLVTEGAITDPTWRDVLATTPRHLFVPKFWAHNEYNSPTSVVSGDDPSQRDEWLDAIYSNESLVTQWAPRTAANGAEYRVVTSSASMPSVVAVMLDRLDVHHGHRVLEIGTGSGYNAALLCCRVGDDRVHSLDIDSTLVTQAAEHLGRVGYHPHVNATNGAVLPDDHTYDRIIATCAINGIPPSWVRQLNPGGRLVAPMSFGGALAVLDKVSDDTLTGHVDSDPVYFMPLRDAPDQLLPACAAFPLPRLPSAAECHRGTTDVDPRIAENLDFQLWFALHLPGSQITHSCTNDGTVTSTIVYTPQDRANARYHPINDGTWPVTQHGRRLWDTVEAAAHAWHRNGQPKRARLGITVRVGDAPTQYAWLDNPDSAYAWPLNMGR